jgi:hypothetical protein
LSKAAATVQADNPPNPSSLTTPCNCRGRARDSLHVIFVVIVKDIHVPWSVVNLLNNIFRCSLPHAVLFCIAQSLLLLPSTRRLNPPGADCRAHAAKAIFPNIYLLIGQGGKAAACLCAAVFASLRAVEKKKKGENPRGGHGSEKGVVRVVGRKMCTRYRRSCFALGFLLFVDFLSVVRKKKTN